MTTDIKTIHVEGLRWWDRVNGNTYHTARVTVDDKLVAVAPFQYGYDEQYLESAMEELEGLDILSDLRYNNGGKRGLRRTCEELDIELTYTVHDGLKRDLLIMVTEANVA